MKIGAFDIIDTAESMRGQSSSCSLPVRKRVWLMRPIELNMRKRKLLRRHFHAEDRGRNLVADRGVLRNVDRQRRFAHRRPARDDDELAALQTRRSSCPCSPKPVDTPVISLVE